ncbi:hypothetical protein [uncultured Endozoicomonas sp.]|uniref:hypothetical protein n=1 Tax=uncultured Endozoicomonas sp. TaxID=432652 RepID=UPI0026138603|nr:hypothetical protein [uncultured Endozoicomonas sp.]
MITLKEDKKFVKVETWTDVTEIAGYHEKLDSSDYKLKEIIGRYVFPHPVQCGLMNCRQPHNSGYIVRTTKDGIVTNIGKDCGKTIFGVEFKQLSRSFDMAVTEQSHRETIADFLFFADEYKKNIETLRQGSQGADAIHSKLKSLTHKNRGCPDVVVSKLNQMIRSRNPDIVIEKELSEKEILDNEAIEGRTLPRPQYREEKIATLKGFSALYPENDLRKRLIVGIWDNLNSLTNSGISLFSHNDLKYWANWCSSYEKEFDDICSIVRQGSSLISTTEISKLTVLINSHSERKLLNQFLKSIKQ